MFKERYGKGCEQTIVAAIHYKYYSIVHLYIFNIYIKPVIRLLIAFVNPYNR
jgi:hypothetical protein